MVLYFPFSSLFFCIKVFKHFYLVKTLFLDCNDCPLVYIARASPQEAAVGGDGSPGNAAAAGAEDGPTPQTPHTSTTTKDWCVRNEIDPTA